MPAQYGPPRGGYPRGRGFPPLFRGAYSDDQLRVSDAERQEVADRLSEHFAAGRLDQAEFDERVGQAMNAKTRADLNGLFADLPDTGAPAVPERPRRRRGHPALAFMLIVLLALTAAHAVFWVTVPWLWLGFLVVALLFVTGHLGHSRAGQDR
jgi:hypothetical protein